MKRRGRERKNEGRVEGERREKRDKAYLKAEAEGSSKVSHCIA